MDKKSVEEKQILVNMMAQEGYLLIGDIAVSKQKELLKKALVASANKDKKSADAYLQEAKKWEEGGAYKLLLHDALGSVLSGMSGQGVSSGMLSATSNEALQTSLAKIQDPELHKLASLVIGRTLGHDVGGAVSSIATEENWLNHYDQMALLADIINYK